MSRGRNNAKDAASESSRPTSETRARLRPDPLLRLLRAGRLEAAHLAAAEEIRGLHEALTLRLGVRALDLAAAAAPRSGRRGRFVQPFERMREDLYRRYRAVYLPWIEELRRTAEGTRQLALVREIVIEGRPLGPAATRLGRRRGDALAVVTAGLRAALDAYARRAGWRTTARYRAAVAA